MKKYNAFFEEYKKEIEFFRNTTPTINDDLVYDNFYETSDFINDLIDLYESDEDITITDIEIALNYMKSLKRFGTDDNTMGLNLRIAYFYCVNAIIEYLDFIRNWGNDQEEGGETKCI